MPDANPIIDATTPPVFVPNQAPAVAGYPAGRTVGMNPQYTGNSTNAAGTSEPLAAHVAAVIAFALLGVFALRALDFKFVVAAGVGS